ncbi:MAG: 16S rRNA (guanine(966)-N(2))-methyltransferase RsmD [Bacteroidetes bacterium]|nr:MAG: 16S rRNA (guanine(966)-N(2))-methyltransferase RsmD [Bacteroidota bacterium]
MRIISGKFGGRPIHPPRGLPVRPTTDKMREALFNILQAYLEWEQVQVLELFCGTAAVSLECISRGAAGVCCVDQDRRCVAAARKMFQQFGVNNARVVQRRAEVFIKQCDEAFDFIFMDPPYQLAGQAALIEAILERGLLLPEGILVVEHTAHLSFEGLPAYSFSRNYGSSSFSFFNIAT